MGVPGQVYRHVVQDSRKTTGKCDTSCHPSHHFSPKSKHQIPLLLQEVCHRYWPEGRGNSELFGKYSVTLKAQENCNDYIVRKMDISDSQATMSPGDNGFTVTQFQYVRWPEDGVPQSTTGVLEMANLVQKVQMGSGNKAIVVMCK